MTKNDAIVAVFTKHREAEAAIHKLAEGGLDIKHFSIIGKGYHSEETVTGFYNTGKSVMLWGQNGAIWGGLWGLLFGGLFMTVPMIGPVVVVGHFAAMVFAAIEGAVVVGGLGALGAALYGLGIPKDSVIEYEEALKADGFLLVAHGPAEEMTRAKAILDTLHPSQIDLHEDMKDMVAHPDHSAASGAAI